MKMVADVSTNKYLKTLLQVTSSEPEASGLTSPRCCASAGAAERADVPARASFTTLTAPLVR